MAGSSTSVPEFVTKYAPVVWLHSKDEYLPSDIGAQLAHTQPKINFVVVDGAPKPLTLDNLDQLNANNGEKVYLTSVDDVTTNPAWLKGVKPDGSGKTDGATPCAIIVNDHGNGSVDAFYMYFFAFNNGGKVLGHVAGTHVGDWEHTMVRFQNGNPMAVWFSQHAFGQAFTYDAVEKQGVRPVAYCAHGTHAIYATTGTHDHTIPGLNLPKGFLEDECDQGTLWDPILSAYFYSYSAGTKVFTAYGGSYPVPWLKFVGRWGDEEYPDSDPRQRKVLGIDATALFVGGPTGPQGKQLNHSSYISPKSNDENSEPNGSIRRKSSFGFLRRNKSRERSVSTGSAPRRKLSRKDRTRVREDVMAQTQIAPRPPSIPPVPSQPEIQTFGGDGARPHGATILSNRGAVSVQDRFGHKSSHENMGSVYYQGTLVPPVPPIPPMPTYILDNRTYMDPLAKGESMANRGRYSYASSAISTINSPRKIRRRKDPTPFKQRRQSTRDLNEDPPAPSEGVFPNFTSHYVETEVEGERIGVTLWDSEGFEKSIVELQVKETTNFIESKFEDTYTEERKVARTPGFRDTHIHCVFMILDPFRLDANLASGPKTKLANGAKAKANTFVKSRADHTPSGLDEDLDLNVLRALKGKTTVVPVISKADTITTCHMTQLKRAVWDSLKQSGLDTIEAIEIDEDDRASDTSTGHGGQRHTPDERDEDRANANTHGHPHTIAKSGRRDISMTSRLDSPSGSDSSKNADFRLASPGKRSKNSERRRSSSSEALAPPEEHLLPLSVLAPDPYEPKVAGRKFPWGFADPYNTEHCDFTKLKEAVFVEWRSDLREASRELWYEAWRTSRLNRKSNRHAVTVGLNESLTAAEEQPKGSRLEGALLTYRLIA
ncbi:MAG: hypothetical protein Q9163_004317 [Psora crenata]